MAFHWRKALSGLVLGAILFLTILPYFGWAWHRVLPEHTHLFFSAHHDHGEEIVPNVPALDNEVNLCLACTETHISAGVVHLPSVLGEQVLGIAVNLAALFWIHVPPAFSDRVILFSILYRSPVLLLLDPPPTIA